MASWGGARATPPFVLVLSETPVFVQVQQNWRQMYLGVCQGKRVRTNFDMVHLHHTPPQYSHLSGLLDVFKDRLVCVWGGMWCECGVCRVW